jgi:hypothetical protein
MTADFGG